MKPFHISVKPYFAESRPNSRATIRIRHASGKVERLFFPSRQEAEFEAKRRRATLESVGTVLTPDDLGKLLRAASHYPDLLAAVLLGAFAGLSIEEVRRLSIRSIDLERGRIDCEETGRPSGFRYATIQPVLAAWLSQLGPRLIQDVAAGAKKPVPADVPPFSSDNEFSIAWIHRSYFKARWRQMLESAGCVTPATSPATTRKGTKNATARSDDTLRDSFASHYLAHFHDPSALRLQLGAADMAIVRNTYRERVTAAQAAAWWQLFPPALA